MSRVTFEPGAVVHFQCLGPVALTGRDRVPRLLRTRKQLGLLFYLARRNRPVARDELIDLLWSEDTEKLARHSLSQCISLINKVLDAEIIVNAGRDRIAVADGSVRLDVNDFERLASDGAYADAALVWRGVLFEGFWIQRAPHFERWLADEREKLQRLYRRLAHARIESLRHGGDHQAMWDEAERLLGHDPLDEKAMLACLEALTLLGDRSLALRRYGEFETRLRRELEAEPGSALRGWAKRIRKADAPLVRDRLPAPRISEITVLPAVQPFFGRTEEFAMLWKAWETAGTGTGAFIIIEGEAGIGKTALATKLVNQAHVAGGSVCFVKCYRTEKSVPFAPITALIRQLSRLPGFVALDPVWIGELTRLVPELRERYPNAPQPMAVDDAARHRLSDAAVNAAFAVADEQPLMMVVDDLLDSDEASLALLHYLGRQTPHLPILFMGIIRAGLVTTEYESTFLETAETAGFANRFGLGQLSSESIERLAQQILARRGIQATETAVEVVVHQSAGNPLHAIEAALSIELLSLVNEANETSTPSPDTFGQSARERLAMLPAHAHQVAACIAIAGRPLAEYELAEITSLSAADLALAIDSLESSQFTRRSGPAVSLLHERYSAVANSMLTEDQQKGLHLRIAELLKSTAARNPAAQFETARHYSNAGRHREAITHALLAAKHANSIGAVRSKAEALELACRLNSTFEPMVTAELAESFLDLGDIAAIEALCSKLRNGSNVPATFLPTIEYFEVAACVKAGRVNMVEAEERLVKLLSNGGTSFAYRDDARVLLMQIADKTGHTAFAKQLARELRRDSKPNELSSRALLATGYVFAKYYWPPAALRILERAVEGLQLEGALALEQFARDCFGIVLKMSGRFAESIEHFDRSLALARKMMDHHGESRCLQNRSVSEISMGLLDQAKGTLWEAQQLKVSEWVFSLYNTYNLGIIALLQGHLAESVRNFEECNRGAIGAHNYLLAGDTFAGLALAMKDMGDYAALACFVRDINDVDPTGTTRVGWIRQAAVAWDVALNGGDPLTAIEGLRTESRHLRRRDIASWLTLELEIVRLEEKYLPPSYVRDHKKRLFESASKYGARFVTDAVR